VPKTTVSGLLVCWMRLPMCSLSACVTIIDVKGVGAVDVRLPAGGCLHRHEGVEVVGAYSHRCFEVPKFILEPIDVCIPFVCRSERVGTLGGVSASLIIIFYGFADATSSRLSMVADCTQAAG
jgi:hypothetical protein